MAYTATQREKILMDFDRFRETGMPMRQAASKAGVPYLTVLRWRKRLGLAADHGLVFKPPAAKRGSAKPKRARLTVVTPEGYRIESEDPQEIIRVLIGLR